MDEEKDSPFLEVSHGVKVLIGSIGSSFLIGMIFWAGATYNRINAIEVHLTSIDNAVAKIGDIQTLEERETEIQRRVDRLEGFQKAR